MKTATITLHDTENCGSSLQAFALQHYLIEHGIENELIDYIPKYTQNGGHIIRTFARKVVYFDATIRQRKKFRNFISEHLVLTKKKYLTIETGSSGSRLLYYWQRPALEYYVCLRA